MAARSPFVARAALALLLAGCADPASSPTSIAPRALQVAYVVDNAKAAEALIEPLRELNLRQTIQGLADFPTRHHESASGQQASVWIRDRWQAYASARSDVTVALIDHEETPQQSISLTIRGSKSPEELVVLGGHMDSINLKGGAAPGADDNASGIAVLDEVIRSALLLGYRPERTVVFYAYAAEEIGLVGSGEIADDAAEQELGVAGVLQLDMTNYNPSPSPYLAIVTDFTDQALNEFARTLIETYVHLPWRNTECGYACSDHGSWQKRGFPVHYVHEATTDESNDFIHTAQDTLELSDGSAQHSLYFAQYSAAFMAELAKGTVDECDANRPCALGTLCEAGICVPEPVAVGGASGSASMGGAGMGGAAGSASPGGVAGGVAGGGDVGGLGGGAGVSAGTTAAAGMPTAKVAAAATTPGAAACSCRAAHGGGTRPAAVLSLLTLAALMTRRRRS